MVVSTSALIYEGTNLGALLSLIGWMDTTELTLSSQQEDGTRVSRVSTKYTQVQS